MLLKLWDEGDQVREQGIEQIIAAVITFQSS